LEKGKGVRFVVADESRGKSAFVIRYQGTVHGYVNRCSHISVELDWSQGEFFDYSGAYLICATHGALYEPASGHCVGGPCQGRGLRKLAIVETGGSVFLVQDNE
jgi:nitrite reductase/ring-hydroxylating ferredoxin subunit